MRTLRFGVAVLLLASALQGQRQADTSDEIGVVTLRDGTHSVPMKQSVPARRARVGIFSSKQYFILGGPKAVIRTTNKTPVFEFVADPTLDEASDYYLFKFDMRSGSREIRVAKSTGGGLAELKMPKDHIIPTTVEAIGDGPNSTKRYRLKPTAHLRPGEYCLAKSIISYYDFGVD